MKFLYGLGGANVPVIKEFELSNPNEAIGAGEALKCTNRGLVGKNVDGKYIGVAAEDHSGKEDILNPRANGNKIRIDITKDAVYSVPMMKLTAVADGSPITFVCEGGFITGNHTTFSLMLISKGEGSTNTDAVGSIRKIDYVNTSSSNYVYEIETGSTPCIGDVYALVPYVGFKGGVDNSYKGMEFCSDTGTELTVVSIDKVSLMAEVKFNDSLFN